MRWEAGVDYILPWPPQRTCGGEGDEGKGNVSGVDTQKLLLEQPLMGNDESSQVSPGLKNWLHWTAAYENLVWRMEFAVKTRWNIFSLKKKYSVFTLFSLLTSSSPYPPAQNRTKTVFLLIGTISFVELNWSVFSFLLLMNTFTINLSTEAEDGDWNDDEVCSSQSLESTNHLLLDQKKMTCVLKKSCVTSSH